MSDSTTPQDDKAMAPASDGSGSGLPSHIFPPEWVEKGNSVKFFGILASELSRDELLAFVGYLAEQIEHERAMHASTLGVMRAASMRLKK